MSYVKVIDLTPPIMVKTARGINLALRMMTDAIDDEAFRKTPKKKGELRKDLHKTVGATKATIRWQPKYAAAQEAGVIRGSRVRHYTTPGTGPHFAENAVKKVVNNGDHYFKRANVI